MEPPLESRAPRACGGVSPTPRGVELILPRRGRRGRQPRQTGRPTAPTARRPRPGLPVAFWLVASSLFRQVSKGGLMGSSSLRELKITQLCLPFKLFHPI